MTAVPSTSRQSARGVARSRQIINASVRLFQDAGFQNVSIDDIGAAVGLTGPAVYRHFKGKYDILVQALVGQVTDVEEMIERTSTGPMTLRLDRLFDELSQLAVARDESMLWRRENRHLEPKDQTDFRTAYGRVMARIKDLVLERRPDLGETGAQFVTVALLSLFSSTRDIRGRLPDQRAVELLTAIANGVVAIDYDHDDTTPPPVRRGPGERRTPAGRRERIVDAAADLFDKHGFYSVRIDDIAKGANCSVATLYQHFEGKTQILQAVLFRGSEGLFYMTAEAMESAVTSRDALDLLIRIYVRQSLGLHGRTMRILATDSIYLLPEQREEFLAREREYVAEWTKAISDESPGLSHGEVRALAHAAIDVLTDLSLTRMLRGRPGLESNLLRLAWAIAVPQADVVGSR